MGYTNVYRGDKYMFHLISQNLWFSGVFMDYKMRTLGRNGLIVNDRNTSLVC